MKLLMFGLLSSVYVSCFEENEYYKEEGRIVGGGNYGGFIGLTTYGAGPFMVKGKYERDQYGGFGLNWQGYRPGYDQGDAKSEKKGGAMKDVLYRTEDDSKKNDRNNEARYIGNVGYEDIQSDGEVRRDVRENEEDLEYLGYRGGDFCIREYDDGGRYGNHREGYRQSRRRSNSSDYYDDETRERCDYLFGFTGPTANDEPENLMRPCALDDWQCIREFFAANAKCKPAFGPIPDPLYIDVNTVFYPTVNLTVALPNLQVRGLSSARITEFYVNKKSGNLVIAFNVTNFNEIIPRAYFRYRRTAKESIVLADYATSTYRAITFTAVIPKVPNLRLDLADIHPDIQDAAPQFSIGPGAVNSTDPDVVMAFTQFNLLISLAIREGLFFKSQLFTSIYIQKNICDFGLKMISV